MTIVPIYRKIGRPSILNSTQQQKVIDAYLIQKLSTIKIAKQFNVYSETIRQILIRNKISLRKASETIRASTTFSFHEMTEPKAFLLGLIYGDGSISIRRDYISVTNNDNDVLEKTQQILGTKFKIYPKIGCKCQYGIIYSHKLCDELWDLFKLPNNKSDKLIFPELSQEFIPAFISGYLAADGCISFQKQKNKSLNPILTLSFYSCSKTFLETLNTLICDKASIPNRKIYQRNPAHNRFGKKPLFILTFNGIKAKAACGYIFESLADKNLVNQRKYKRYASHLKLLSTTKNG